MVTRLFLLVAEHAARSGYPGFAGVLCRLLLRRRPEDEVLFGRVTDLLIAAGALAQAERLCRQRLSVRLHDPAAMERLAFMLLDSSCAGTAAELFGEIDRLRGVEADITKAMKLRTYLQDSYVSEPAPGRKNNDIRLVAGVAYTF